MTLRQMECMTKLEREQFYNVNEQFDIDFTLDTYTEAIRDYIFLFNKYDSNKKNYSFADANKVVALKSAEIKSLFEECEPVGSAVVEVEYFCG